MAALYDGLPAMPGFVEPAYRWEPPDARKSVDSLLVAETCAKADFAPDDEQQMILDAIFALAPDGTSAAFETGVVAPRQNVKTAAAEMAVIGWLFVIEVPLVIWTAHEFPTAEATFLHMEQLVTSTPSLSREVRAISHGNGDEGILLKSGCQVQFRTRTKGGARGISGDKIVFDEGYALRAHHMGALVPIMSARPDGQMLYLSSAGMADSAILRDIRDRGRAGDDPALAYFEWCAPPPEQACDAGAACMHARTSVGCGCDKPELLQQANLAITSRTYGIVCDGERIGEETGPPRLRLRAIRGERRSMTPAEFGRERMGWWDAPAEGISPITTAAMERALDSHSQAMDPVALAVTVALDRSSSAIGIAGWRKDGKAHVELVEHRPGTGWTLKRLTELSDKYKPCAVVINPASPAGAFEKTMTSPLKPGADARFATKPEPGAKRLKDGQTQLHLMTSREYAQSCGAYADAIVNDQLRHIGQQPLTDATEGARTHESAGAWIWSAKDSPADITPIEVVTLALHGLVTYGRKKPPPGPFMLVGR